ncbi:MAG: alpha/beta fold hydrolase [Methylophaga sp.]|nr:alpha/beta fold hydrolase [Methylophaga sp.]
MKFSHFLFGLIGCLLALPAVADSAKQVVLLHGLARSAGSMHSMAEHLQDHGFKICNIDYPSRHHPIEILAADFVVPAIRDCFATGRINFVSHSLGGIIVRQLAAKHTDIQIGRVVMLAPPNQGSEVVDKLGNFGLFNWLNGPAGQQLGTAKDSLPNQLGPATFALGVITGNRSINLILSGLIPGPDDGKVAVKRAGLEGMRDFLVVEQTHPFIMGSDEVQQQTLIFLQTGQFE